MSYTVSQKTCHCRNLFPVLEEEMRKNILVIFGVILWPLMAMAQQQSISLTEVEVRGVSMQNDVASLVPRQQIAQQDMLRMGIFNIEEALKHMAGITVKDYGGAGGMKTVSVRGVGAKHMAVAYDGVTLTDCQTGEIDLSRYNLANMQSLQLTIGDGNDIFVPARNIASASILDLQTDLGDDSDKAKMLRAGVAVGAWGTIEPSFFYRTKLGSRASMNVQGDYIYTENNYPFTLYNVDVVTRERRKNSRMSSGHVETNVAWQLNDWNKINGKLYYYDNSRQLPGIVRLYTQDNDERLKEKNAFGQVHYLGLWSSKLSMKAAAKINWATSRYRVGMTSGGIKSESYWQREYYATSSWLYTPTHWLAMNYSIDYAFNNLNSTLRTPTSSVNGPISEHPYRHSLLQAISGKLMLGRLTGVARLLWSNSVNGVKYGQAPANAHQWSPSLSLSYKLLPHRSLYARASWKNTFRVPTFNELFYYHIGSAALEPENTQQWNLGVTGDFVCGPYALNFTVDTYYSKVSNKIVAIPFNMFVWRMMNISKVGAYGIDVTTDVVRRLGKRNRLELIANYSLQNAQNRTNRKSPNYRNQIAYTPQHTFATTLSWNNPWVNLAVTADGMSARWTTNEHASGTRIAGFAEVGLSAYRTFSFSHANLTLRGGIQNLFDKQYDIVAHYPMPGRAWKLSAMIAL